ncbi:uncharacterized protein LOC123553446 [Mercenaria mercenaria]|uniref:uncharacterized protein LOC123553446 n=1 Tax=Mercenaria mercenaria TaxID=6596 RepID=UPI001E1D45CD|nr:uncharacterized protein LOC123553446 [Mercenaria mercenaria]
MIRLLVLLGLCCVLPFVELSQDFIDDVVRRHNELRMTHGVNNVTEDTTITAYAQEWADHLASTGQFYHRPNNSYGENLAFRWPAYSGAEYVDQLYTDEEAFYASHSYYGSEPNLNNFAEYGHFTQIVWKACTKIGVGNNGPFVVINYDAGNLISTFAVNVLAPQ